MRAARNHREGMRQVPWLGVGAHREGGTLALRLIEVVEQQASVARQNWLRQPHRCREMVPPPFGAILQVAQTIAEEHLGGQHSTLHVIGPRGGPTGRSGLML